MKSKNYLAKLKAEAEFIVNKCLSHDFNKLRKVDNQKLFEGKDLKIIGDNLISREISKYLEKTTSVKVISEENFELISKEVAVFLKTFAYFIKLSVTSFHERRKIYKKKRTFEI